MPVSARERDEIAAAMRTGKVFRGIGIAQAARLPRAGRPHVADEVVVVSDGGTAPPRPMRAAWPRPARQGAR